MWKDNKVENRSFFHLGADSEHKYSQEQIKRLAAKLYHEIYPHSNFFTTSREHRVKWENALRKIL